jgi:hypothetical protein
MAGISRAAEVLLSLSLKSSIKPMQPPIMATIPSQHFKEAA